jgi:hypothetical protein
VKALACDLGAFDAAERRRYDALRAELARARVGAEELPDGFVFLYPGEPDLFRKLSEWIILERRCCPFLSFSLRFDAEPPAVRLELVGGEGVKGFLQSQLAG